MENKYELNYMESMHLANEYLDLLEETLREINENHKEHPENYMPMLEEVLLNSQDELYLYLLNKQHQAVCNQLVLFEMNRIFVRDVVEENDISLLDDYLYSITEEMLIYDVTKVIDNFNK